MAMEQKIIELFYQGVIKYLEGNRLEHPMKDTEIEVSELVMDCPRHTFFVRSLGNIFVDLSSINHFFIGRKVHEIQVLKESEKKVSWNGIRGSVDDYEDGILLEKKTTTSMPKYPRSHNVTQAEYYKVLLEKNHCPVLRMFILYYDVSKPDDLPVVFPIKCRDSKTIEDEMVSRKEKLLTPVQENRLPGRHMGWICKYCNFIYLCFMNDMTIRGIVKGAKDGKLTTIPNLVAKTER